MRSWLLLLAVLTAACAPPTPLARTSPHPRPSASADARAFIPTAEKFVEQHRGLKFKHPVKVTFLSDADFRARVTARNDKDRSDLNVEFKDLRALHLVPPTLDILKAEDELLGSGVVGFYDPKTKELVVRGTDASASTRHVLVHELTHALQDQYYPLDALDSDNDDERPVAWRALIEGDAVRVENAYIATLTPAERSSIYSGTGGQTSGDIPTVMVELLAFPYAVGPRFVDAVMAARGGQSGLDGAFASPPKTSTEVIHPDRFLAGFTPADVPSPSADAAEFDHGVLGEMGLTLLLERLVPRPLTSTDARDLAQGWDGDRYVAWDSADKSCVRDTVAEDSQAHTARLATALSALPGAVVIGNGPLTVTICG
ncbi:MAG TPA: hypothetical protein VF160_06480 [Candidatus Dormibacteraeota bacterium]